MKLALHTIVFETTKINPLDFVRDEKLTRLLIVSDSRPLLYSTRVSHLKIRLC